MTTPDAGDHDAPPPDRDHADTTAEPADIDPPTGQAQAQENTDNESPG